MVTSQFVLSLVSCLVMPLAFGQDTSSYVVDWSVISEQSNPSHGDGTYYGAGQDYQGACSYGQNFANANSEPWSTGVEVTIAMNDYQFANSGMCGTCLMFKGTGGDKPNMGTNAGTILQDKEWHMAQCTNKCPECSPGDIDLARNGDGRWLQEWYAVPCNVGSSNLKYHIPHLTDTWMSLVVSNHKFPIKAVAINWDAIGSGNWISLPRTVNNQWPYYGTYGSPQLPMRIQVTSVQGEILTDTISNPNGNDGTVQFQGVGSSGNSSSSSSSNSFRSSQAATPTPTPIPAAAASTNSYAARTNQTIPGGGQCGGMGGFCSQTCRDAMFDGATCAASYQCLRFSQWWWGCGTPGSNSTSSGQNNQGS